MTGDSDELDLVDEIDVALVGHGERFEGGLTGGLCADGFALVEEVVFRGERAEAVAETKRQAHLIGIIIIVENRKGMGTSYLISLPKKD